jgi:hypothetical protein
MPISREHLPICSWSPDTLCQKLHVCSRSLRGCSHALSGKHASVMHGPAILYICLHSPQHSEGEGKWTPTGVLPTHLLANQTPHAVLHSVLAPALHNSSELRLHLSRQVWWFVS